MQATLGDAAEFVIGYLKLDIQGFYPVPSWKEVGEEAFIQHLQISGCMLESPPLNQYSHWTDRNTKSQHWSVSDFTLRVKASNHRLSLLMLVAFLAASTLAPEKRPDNSIYISVQKAPKAHSCSLAGRGSGASLKVCV